MTRVSPDCLLLVFSMVLTACGSVSPETAPTPAATVGPDATVCAAGCDFSTIQAAVDAAMVVPGAVTGLPDSVHTEAGILIRKAITIQGQGANHTIVQAHAVLDEATDRVFTVARGNTVALGGHHVQFNVVDAATLRAAQAHPEHYRDLIVRVAGYSDYFCDLGKALQDEIIVRTTHKGF